MNVTTAAPSRAAENTYAGAWQGVVAQLADQAYELEFFVPGEAKGDARRRPGVNQATGRAQTFPTKANLDARGDVRTAFALALRDNPIPGLPWEGPAKVDIIDCHVPSKSNPAWPGKHCDKKPDWDNSGKLVGDALNLLAWQDDRRIVLGAPAKTWWHTAGKWVRIRFYNPVPKPAKPAKTPKAKPVAKTPKAPAVVKESRLTAEPVLKWAGGKRKLLDQYEPYLPAKFGAYHEPFFGGGVMFFWLWSLGRLDGKVCHLGDANSDLMNFYRVLRLRDPALFAHLASHQEQHGKEHYYEVRKQNPAELSSAELAARLCYLNRTCFNGLPVQVSWPGNTLLIRREDDVERYRWQRGEEVLEGTDPETIERALLELRVFSHSDLESQMLDPRLAEVPEDLRKLVCEFLTLHDAWFTDFRLDYDPCSNYQWITLEWGSDQAGQKARLALRLTSPNVPDDRGNARLWWWGDRGKHATRFSSCHSERNWHTDEPMDRSADFAEYVQRFPREAKS